MPDTAAFWDKIADRYAARPVGDAAAYEATLDRVRAHLTPEAQVLELGCGTGTTALNLAPSLGQITATDFSPAMIEIARGKGDGVDNARFEVAPARPNAAEAYDAILAFNLLHLLDDLDASLREIHAALTPGGVFISKTPCLGDRKRFLIPLVWVMQKLGKAPEPVHFVKSGPLEDRIAGQGFEIIETGDYPASVPSHFIVARKV